MKNLFLFTTALVALNANAQTRPTVTITGASHVPVELPKVGSSVSLITADDIQTRGITTLAEALQSLPSVYVSQSGDGINTARIRGAESRHSLVVVDGVVYNDVNDGTAYLDNFPVQDIERIEVVRGPQSGVHGAAANAGAIIITTKSGKGFKKPSLNASFEIGSLNTQRARLSAQGAKDRVYGSISIDANQSRGWNISPIGNEKDGNSSMTFTQKLGMDINEQFNIEGFVRFQNKANSYDSRWFGVADDASASNRQNTLASLKATYKALDGKLVHTLSFDSNAMQDRNYDQDGAFLSINKGTRLNFTYKNAYRIDQEGAKHTLVSGVQSTREELYVNYLPVDNKVLRSRNSVFGEYLLDLKQGTSLTGAARYDVNTAFSNIMTYRLSAAHSFANTGSRLHGSFGKGANNPSFYDQFGYPPLNFGSNLGLRPEQSLGYDIGFEQKWFGGKLLTDVTYYNLTLKDAFSVAGFWPTNYVINSTKSLPREGVELTASWLVSSWFSVNGSYSLFRGKDNDDLNPVRRPNNSASLSAVATLFDGKGKLSATLNHNGGMRDSDYTVWPSPSVNLKPFTLLNAQFAYDITKTTTAYVRGENLLNAKYQEVYSYNAAPMQIFAGVRVKLGE